MKAISIALIPAATTDLEWLIEASAQIGDGESFLNRSNKLPHLTLGMGVINEDETRQLVREVKMWEEIQLETNTISVIQREGEADLIWLNLDRSSALMKLHETAMNLLDYDETKVLPAFFNLPNELNGREMQYVQSFETNAFEHYQPHITLGYGMAKKEIGKRSIKMKAGVFHLGPSCACHSELT